MIFHSSCTLVLKEKNNLQTGVIVLMDNIDRDKELNTVCSLESPVDISLSLVLFKLYNRQSIFTTLSYHKFKPHKRTNDCVHSKLYY